MSMQISPNDRDLVRDERYTGEVYYCHLNIVYLQEASWLSVIFVRFHVQSSNSASVNFAIYPFGVYK